MNLGRRISAGATASALLAGCGGVGVVAAADAATVGPLLAPIAKRPERVRVLSARPFAHRVTVDWEAAADGPRPTGYQIKVVGRDWHATARSAARVKGLRADHSYRVKVRAVRGTRAGPAVIIYVTTQPA